jgi:hypothetical protein
MQGFPDGEGPFYAYLAAGESSRFSIEVVTCNKTPELGMVIFQGCQGINIGL